MRLSMAFALVVSLAANVAFAGAPPRQSLPAVAEGWSIELVAEAPEFCFLQRSLQHPMARSTSAPTRWTCPVRRPSRSIAYLHSKEARRPSLPTSCGA